MFSGGELGRYFSAQLLKLVVVLLVVGVLIGGGIVYVAYNTAPSLNEVQTLDNHNLTPHYVRS